MPPCIALWQLFDSVMLRPGSPMRTGHFELRFCQPLSPTARSCCTWNPCCPIVATLVLYVRRQSRNEFSALQTCLLWPRISFECTLELVPLCPPYMRLRVRHLALPLFLALSRPSLAFFPSTSLSSHLFQRCSGFSRNSAQREQKRRVEMAAEQPLDHELILAAARDYVDKSNRGEVTHTH